MRKLAEIHGEEAMELISLLVYVGQKVMADKEMKKYFSGKEVDGSFAADFFRVLFGKYRKDCTKMLAAIEGVSEKEYLENSDIMKITADMGALGRDATFNDLFFASVQSRTSGSASENTKGQK